MTPSTFIPAEYGPVLLTVLALCFLSFVETFPVGAARKRVFSKEFFERHFPGTNPTPNKQGYPDTGYGRYADKLSHNDWLILANAQRVHGHLLEQLPFVVCTVVRATPHSLPNHSTLPLCCCSLLSSPSPVVL